MSFLLVITLCNALTNECDDYVMDSNLTKAECVAIIRTETMPMWLEETYKLDSFDSANCEVLRENEDETF